MASKEKILVVDDEPSIRKYLQTLLEVDGFEVETVSSGKEALAKVNAGERPDFIILDVLMPEMNGPALAQRLIAGNESHARDAGVAAKRRAEGIGLGALRFGAQEHRNLRLERQAGREIAQAFQQRIAAGGKRQCDPDHQSAQQPRGPAEARQGRRQRKPVLAQPRSHRAFSRIRPSSR